MRPARGMTLLEVLVALAVFALAGLALVRTVTGQMVALGDMEEKTLATWVVENQLVQQKLEGKTQLMAVLDRLKKQG